MFAVSRTVSPWAILGFALVEVLHRKAEEVAGAGEAEAGARGIVAEERDAEPGIEHAAGDVVFAQAAQDFRHEEGRGDFVIAFFPREEEVVLIQAGGVKRGEPPDELADADRIHDASFVGLW